MRILPRASAIVCGFLITAATAVHAEPIKCSRTIVHEYGKYLATVTATLDKCKSSVISKGAPALLAQCPDPDGQQKIDAAAASMKSKIAKACGGADGLCNGAGDDTLSSINWNIGQCMGFEGQCAIPITNCRGVGNCLECIGHHAVEQSVDATLYDGFDPASFFPNNHTDPGATNNKCQAAIAKAGVKFLLAKTKAIGKCWESKVAGKPGFVGNVPCPDVGGPSTIDAIVKAEHKKIAAICKACGGGGDADGNGHCDIQPGLALSAIVTTPYQCTDVNVPANAVTPGGRACGSIAVTDLDSYIDCIDCVLEFKADCATSAGVGDGNSPAGIAYPAECDVSPPPPTCGNGTLDLGEACDPAIPGSCPGNARCAPDGLADACTCPTGSFTLNTATGADFDIGWYGIDHDQPGVSGRLFDALTYGCSGAGPDTSCSFQTATPSSPFGAPLPISAGAVETCIVYDLVGDARGTLDLGTGELHYDYDAIGRYYQGLSISKPCPTCVGDPVDDDNVAGGTCSGGASDGAPCDANGTSPLAAYGKTSVDCLPDPLTLLGSVPIKSRNATTETKTIVTSGASPNCTGFGFEGAKCLCETCDDAAGTACASNADCAPGGICGGLRCGEDAPTPGTPCSTEGTGTDPACGAGTCGRVGIASKPNACSNGMCVAGGAGPDDSRCQTAPTDNICAIETFRGCVNNAGCPAPGDTCIQKRRECFTPPVVKTGVRGTTSGTYVAAFCVAPLQNGSGFNGYAGLPGLETIRQPYTLNVNVP